MEKILFDITEEKEFTMIKFESDGVLIPEDLYSLSPPTVRGVKGVVLSGRGPIWLYCFLTHFYHPTAFIATYDPRLEGAVIVESHSVNYTVGSVLKC